MTKLKFGLQREQSKELAGILRNRIANGTWPPGYRFSWPQLVEEFELNVTEMINILAPALRGMKQDGLIESRPYVGVRVVIEGETWGPGSGESDVPHDEYIETVIRRRLHEGMYRPNEQFVPLQILAEEFEVSVMTVRKALKALREQGILEVRSSGRFCTFVCSNLKEIPEPELLRQPIRQNIGRGKLRAFGEERTFAEWTHDSRCVVSRQVLRSRYIFGWTLEDALTKPKEYRPKHPPKTLQIGA